MLEGVEDTDPASGYRSYNLDQVAVLNRILQLRDFGMKLDVVGTIIQATSTWSRNENWCSAAAINFVNRSPTTLADSFGSTRTSAQPKEQ